MLHSLNTLFRLSTLRAKPEDLPYAFNFMLVTIITYLSAEYAISLMIHPPLKSLVISVVDTALLIGLAIAGLWIKSLLNRGVKTVSALAGSGAIIKSTALVLLYTFNYPPQEKTGIMVYLVLYALLFWKVLVIGFILRSSLHVPIWVGIGISVLYVYTSTRILAVLAFA